jgi:O-antigen/teichoic acid export membrane protein
MMIAASLVAAGVLSLLTSIILARSVSVTEFGFYSITISLQNVVSIFSSFSIGMAVAKFVAEYSVRDVKHALKFARTGLRLVLMFSTVTAIIYFALADPIGNGLYGEPGVADLIPFSALVVFSGAVLALASGVAQGNHRMKLLSSMQVSTPVISLSIIVAFLPYVGIRIAFMGLFAAQMTVALSAMYRLGRTGFPMGWSVEPDADTHYPKLILSFAVPAVIGVFMVAPLYWFGNTVLALESGFLAVGHFAVAMVFFQALSLLPNSLVIPLVPRVSEMSVHSREQIEPLISRSLRAVSVLSFPLFFAVALFSRDIVGILYGPEYYDSGEAVYLMVAACYYSAMAATIGAAIAGLGRMWVGLGLNMIWASVIVVTTLIAAPVYGPEGLGLAYAVSYGVHLATSMVVSDKVLNLRIRNVLVTIIPSIALFVVGFPPVTGVNELPVLVKLALLAVGTGLMVYLGRIEFRMVFERVFKRGHRSM